MNTYVLLADMPTCADLTTVPGRAFSYSSPIILMSGTSSGLSAFSFASQIEIGSTLKIASIERHDLLAIPMPANAIRITPGTGAIDAHQSPLLTQPVAQRAITQVDHDDGLRHEPAPFRSTADSVGVNLTVTQGEIAMGKRQRVHMRKRLTGPTKDLRPLINTAQRQRWTVDITGSGHLRWKPPNGGNIYFSALTPSDRRAIRQIRSELRRRGLKV